MKNLTAVIEFSLLNIQFIIAQKIDEKIEILENSTFPIELYKTTNNKDRLNQINKISNILLEIKKSIKAYGINLRSIKLFAGDNINYLKNKEFIKEQIKIKTGFNLEILDFNKEAIFLYKKMYNLYQEDLKKETAMFLFMSYDKITFYILSKGRVIYYQNFSITPIRLKELLTELNFNPEKTETLVDEYLKSYFDMFKKFFPEKPPTKLYLISEDLADIFSHLNKKTEVKETLNSIEQLLGMSDLKIKKEFHLDDNELHFFKEKLYIAKATIRTSKVADIVPINYSLINVILHNSFFLNSRRRYDNEVRISTLKSCEYLSKRYAYDELHSLSIKDYSKKIFDELSKLHQLQTRDLLILEGAAILHDIGKYVNLKEHYRISYDLIISSSIFGFSEEELKKVAILAYFHSKSEPDLSHPYFSDYADSEKIKLIKLIAILRVADSLDRSHSHHIKELNVKIEGNKMIIEVPTKNDLLVEKWAFEKKSSLFSEVFGLILKLSIVRR